MLSLELGAKRFPFTIKGKTKEGIEMSEEIILKIKPFNKKEFREAKSDYTKYRTTKKGKQIEIIDHEKHEKIMRKLLQQDVVVAWENVEGECTRENVQKFFDTYGAYVLETKIEEEKTYDDEDNLIIKEVEKPYTLEQKVFDIAKNPGNFTNLDKEIENLVTT